MCGYRGRADPVDDGRRVEVHAEGGDGPRPRLGVGRRGEPRASEVLLNTGRERGVVRPAR